MKNLLICYILILAPLGAIIWLVNTKQIDATVLVSLLFFYSLVYRTCIDGKKLADKNVIVKKDIWTLIVPGVRWDYFKELYFR